MNKLPRIVVLVATLLSSILLSRRAEAAAPSGRTLKDFFASHGFGGAPLQRRLGNHLFVATNINGRRTALLVDTGAPITLIDRNSVGTLGLSVTNTNIHYGGLFERRWERFGVSKVNSISMGNCTITNVPVALADESDMNQYGNLTHIDGLFGGREMVKFGMVIDCARQMLYISPNGPSAAASQQLAATLSGRGFTRIPLRLTSNHHFDVPGSINGHAVRLVIDTGASTTILAKQIAVQDGVTPGSFGPFRVVEDSGEGHQVSISSGTVKELQVGDFKITNADVELGPVSGSLEASTPNAPSAGLFGADLLAFNFAVIDLGGMALYLRHSD
jgi:predicted aspartyl protease